MLSSGTVTEIKKNEIAVFIPARHEAVPLPRFCKTARSIPGNNCMQSTASGVIAGESGIGIRIALPQSAKLL